MTSSGTSSFTQTRDSLIRRSLRLIGAISAGETPAADMVQDAALALNAMVKHWDASGIHLWTEVEGTLWLTEGQVQYGLGGGSLDHATLWGTWTQTTLAASATNGSTSLTLTSASGFASGFYVGVVLDTGNLFWTTESGAPSGVTVTLSSGITDSATAGALVYTYQTQVERPLRVPAARRLANAAQPANQIETPMNPMLSRLDYRSLPNKFTPGVPTQAFYDPQLGTGQFYIWPAPQDSSSLINFTFYRQIQDFDTAANTPDLPQEWLQALAFNLAVVLAPEYDCPPGRFQLLQAQAEGFLETVQGWDREPESYLFGVSLDQRSGV